MNRMPGYINRLKFLPAVSLLIAGLAVGGVATTSPAAQQRHSPFVTVLMRNWDKWDTNHDGELSISEIDKVIADPAVKGADAAAAGTLKLMSRSKKVTVPPLTRDYFAQYDRQTMAHPVKATTQSAETATIDTIAPGAGSTVPSAADKNRPIRWDLYFSAGKSRIAKAGGAWPSRFNLDVARQGALGDCYLIATIGSMVDHNPSEVEQLVKPASDGTYRITLPGVTPFVLQPLTDSQLVLSSTAAGQGEWLAVLEQGVGKHAEKPGANPDDDGTDAIANGGHLDAAMVMLTGHKFIKYRIPTTIAHRTASADKILPGLRKALISAIHENQVITADVTPPILSPTTQPVATTRPMLTADMLPKIPPNINTKHAYAVLDYDAASDMLEIWNPHGQLFTPKGPDGLVNGYKTVHGRFHIPLNQAYTFFTSFVFEKNVPATQPVATAVNPVHPG